MYAESAIASERKVRGLTAERIVIAEDLDLRVRAPRPERTMDEVVLAPLDLVGADRFLEREHEPCTDRLDDRRRASLLANRRLGVVQCPVGLTKRIVPPPGTDGTRFWKSERFATRTPGVPGPPMNLCGDRNTASL